MKRASRVRKLPSWMRSAIQHAPGDLAEVVWSGWLGQKQYQLAVLALFEF